MFIYSICHAFDSISTSIKFLWFRCFRFSAVSIKRIIFTFLHGAFLDCTMVSGDSARHSAIRFHRDEPPRCINCPVQFQMQVQVEVVTQLVILLSGYTETATSYQLSGCKTHLHSIIDCWFLGKSISCDDAINTPFWKHMVDCAIVWGFFNVEKPSLEVTMFDELPTELVERILAFLTYEEKVAVLGVCKRWIFLIKSMKLCLAQQGGEQSCRKTLDHQILLLMCR